MAHIPIALSRELLEAALDQPAPTGRLQRAVNQITRFIGHPDRAMTVPERKVAGIYKRPRRQRRG